MKSKEDKILIASVIDKYKKYMKSNVSTSTNFLDARKLKIVVSELNREKIPYNIYEPYDFLEKRIIYFGNYEDFVTFYKVSFSTDIKHRDILGTLFSLGIDMDLIGDIFVEEGYFYYTNLTKMNKLLENDFVMIKNEPIKLTKVEEIKLLKKHFEEFNILTSSLRIDTVISKITNKSRTIASEMLKEGNILLNYEEVKSVSIYLNKDDILSIRKYGKYKIGEEIGKTKKDNIILKIIKYI